MSTKSKSTRVVLYFPSEHPISQIPEKNRNFMTKEMVNFALEFKKEFLELKAEVQKIRKILETGQISLNTGIVSSEEIEEKKEIFKELLSDIE